MNINPRCSCTPLDDYYLLGTEYDPECRIHSVHLYDPRIQKWILDPRNEIEKAVMAERERAAAHAKFGYAWNETCDDITRRILSGEEPKFFFDSSKEGL